MRLVAMCRVHTAALILLFLGGSTTLFAQFDSEFWMPPIWRTDNAAHNQPSSLFISTSISIPVDFHVETPDGTTFTFDGTVSSGAPVEIPLTIDLGQTTVSNTNITDNGFLVTSSYPIQVVHKVSASNNQTLVTLKGDNALGQDFWCGSQTQNGAANGANERHWISVMATEDNTTVTLETPFDMVGFEGQSSFNISLDRNESYVMITANAQNHVAGAHVTSDKDIAVISGSTHTQFAGQSERDGGVDQLVPLELLGREYALVKGLNADPGDYALIVSSADNNAITIDGDPTPVATLNAGEFYEYFLPGGFGSAHLIQSDENIAVFHVTGASSNQEVGMSAIPRLICTGSRYIEFSRFTENTSAQVFTLLVANESLASLTVNGDPYQDVPGVVVNAVPASNFTAVSIPDAQVLANNIIQSEDGFFHAGYLTGNGTATGTYGYLSGFDEAFDFIDPATGFPTDLISLDTLCAGETVDFCFEIVSCSFDHNIDGVSGNEGNVVLTPITSPFDSCFAYTAPANFVGADTMTFSVSNFLGFDSEVDVVFSISDPTLGAEAGDSQELCSESSTTLAAENIDPYASYAWSVFNGGGTLASPNQPVTAVTDLPNGVNTFLLSATYPCGDVFFDVMQVIVYDGTPPAADAGLDGELCSGSTFPLDANDPGNSAVGTWEVLQGQAFISDINDPNTVVSNLAVGLNVLQWNVTNGDCPGGETLDQITITVFDAAHPAASAGDDQSFCSASFTEANVTGNAPTFPATASWVNVDGAGNITDPNNPNTTITGLTPGTYDFAWVIDNGPCGLLTDTLQITVYDDNLALPVAGPDAAYCLPTTDHTMAAVPVSPPATAAWTLVAGTGAISDSSDPVASISNLGVGANSFSWTIANGGCAQDGTSGQITITVFDNNQPPADAGPDAAYCNDTFTEATLQAVAAAAPATGTWTVVNGTATFADASDPNTTVTGLAPGTNTLQWTVNNGTCGSSSDEVVITLFEAVQVAVDAGDDMAYCTPTSDHVMNAVGLIFPATGFWTLVSGTGTIADPSDPSTSVSGLGVGNNVFRWSLVNGPCGVTDNFDEVTITIFDENQPDADAGSDQSACLNPALPLSVNLSANAPVFPGTGLWTVTSGGGTLSDPTDPNAILTDLSVGETVLTWTLSNGACTPGSTADAITITVFDAFEPLADAGSDQNLCFDNPSTQLAANVPALPAVGTWSVSSGSGSFDDPNDPNATVSGLAVGTNVLLWTVDNGPCGTPSIDAVTITVFDDTVPPVNAGADIFTCSDQEPVVLNGSPVSPPAAGQWTVISGTATFADDTNPTASVTGLSLGEVVLEWTVDNGPCGVTNSDQVSVFVSNAAAPLANAGPDQDICSLDPTATMAANGAEFPGAGTWSLISGSGTITNPNDPLTTITGLAVGSNTFQWQINNAPCVPANSIDFVTIDVYDGTLPAADAGPDQSFCSQITTTTLAGNPLTFPATGTWSLVSGSGTIATPSSATSAVSGLAVGENIFEWTVDNGPCGAPTSDQVSVFIFDVAQVAAQAGDDITVCFDPLSGNPAEATLMGNAVTFPATGGWTLVSGGGTLSDPTNPNATVTDLAVGENIFEWSIDNGPCGVATTDQVSVFVFDDAAPVATAGLDQIICNTTTQVTMAANSAIFPATGSWTLVSGAGTFANANDPQTTVSGLAVGENIFAWTIDNSGCAGSTSVDEVSVFVYANGADVASAGPDQDLCTPDTDTFLQANSATFPATGSWALISGSGVLADPSDPGTEVTGLAVGENIFEWTIDNGPCANGLSSDQVSIFVFDSGADAPDAGPDQELCSPNFSAQLAAAPAEAPGVGTWQVVSGTGTVTDINDPNSSVTGLSLGVNALVWELNYATCGSPTDTLEIIVYDSSLAPAFAGDDQAFCAPTSASVLDATAVAQPAFGTWTLIAGTGSITGSGDPNAPVDNLTIGENVFQWSVYNGGCSPADDLVDEVSIFIFDNNQPDASAGPDQFLCTPNTDTFLAGNDVTFPAVGMWTLVSGAGSVTNPGDPLSAVTDLAIGENVFQWSVTNGTCPGANTTDEVSIFVFDAAQAVADAGPDQFLCTPVNNINLDGNNVAFPASGTWTLVSGSGNILNPTNPDATVNGLAVGENIFQWTVDNGPCGVPSTDLVSVFVYNDFNAVAAAGADQELCLPQTATFLEGNTPQFPAVGTWSVQSGTATIANVNDPNTEITGLGVGENVLVWSVNNGPCSSGVTTDQVSIFVFDDGSALANAGTDQALCLPQTDTFLNAAVPDDPGTGFWILVSGAGTIVDPTNPQSEVTGLGVGENVFQWEVDNGPCALSGSTDQVVVAVFDDTQPDADAGPDQQLCSPVVATTLFGNAVNEPAVGTWTLFSGNGTIQDTNDPNTAVTNLGTGDNVFVWTVSNGSCANALTTDTVMVSVFNVDLSPVDAGEDQELCLPSDGTDLDAADLSAPATGQWSVVAGTGTFQDDTADFTSVDGLSVGTNTFVWTVSNGICGTSSDTVNVLLFDPNAPAANAGSDQFLCTPQTTTTLSGNLPDLPGNGFWSLVSGTATITDPSDPNTVVSGLTIGENILTWTIYNGPCAEPTVDSVSVFIHDENAPNAFAGDNQSFCLPTTSTTLNAEDPIFPATGQWTLFSGTGTFDDSSDPQTMVTGLSLGENTFVWSVDNAPCVQGVTTDTVTVFIFDNIIAAPFAGDDQSFCTPASTTVLEADPLNAPNTGTWSVFAGSGSFVDPTDPNTAVEGMTVGVNTFVWSVDNGPCPTGAYSDTVNVFIYDGAQPAAFAGPDQEFCLPTDAAVLSGNLAIAPALGTWSLVSGTGAFSDANDPNTAVTGLSLGTNLFAWTIENGVCPNATTTDTVAVVVFEDEAPLAAAGPDFQICTPQSTVQLNASPPADPTVGTWSWVSGGGIISDVNDPSATVSGLIVGEHILQWSVYNGPCSSGESFDFVTIEVFDANSPAADAGEDQDFCAPISSTQLDAADPVFPAAGQWTLLSGSGSIQDVNDPNTAFNNLSIGTNVLVWTVNNGPCAQPGEAASDTLMVTVYDPSSPLADAGEDQFFCTPFGGATLDGNFPDGPAQAEWSLFSGSGVFTNTALPNTTVFDLGLGENIFVWIIDNGPCSGISSDTVSVFINDISVAAANAGEDHSSCGGLDSLQMAGSVTIGNTATGMWSVINGGGSFGDPGNEATFVYDIPIGINQYVWTVDNMECGISSDTVTVFVNDPDLATAFAGFSEFVCENEFSSFDLQASPAPFPATGSWSIAEGPIEISDPLDPNASVDYLGFILEPLTTVTNTLIWTVENGTCGTSQDSVTFILQDCLTIDVPNAFSPNSDGFGDEFGIPNLENYPNNSIVIFNRWGSQVYEASPYQGDWDGRSTNALSLSGDLPVSTYYYVLDLGDGSEQLTGFIYLRR